MRNAFSLRVLVIALFAAAVAGAPGCKKETNTASTSGASGNSSGAPKNRKVFKVPAGQTPKLAFVTNNASDFWKIAQAGVQKFTSETGQQVDIKIPSQATVAEQNKHAVSCEIGHGEICFAVVIKIAHCGIERIERVYGHGNRNGGLESSITVP